MTIEALRAPQHRVEFDRRSAEIERFLRRKQLVVFAIPALAFLYLIYAAIAFDVAGLIERARLDRGAHLLWDMVGHKVVAQRDNRNGAISVAIEGEKASTFETPPDWARIDGERAELDLGKGHAAQFTPEEILYRVPGYGEIRLTVSKSRGVEARFPTSGLPAWASVSKARVDLRPQGSRLIVTRARVEAHRYFWGWEEFFFTVNSPFYGKSWGELWSLAAAAPPIEAERSNLGVMLQEFLDNSSWVHAEVFRALLETALMAFLGTLFAALVSLPLAFLAARNFTPSQVGRFGLRRVFDFVRGVDALIWTIVLSRAFGPGPMTGALSIAVTETGTFGKLYSEAFENVDKKQIDGVASTGAGPLQRYAFGVMPQVTPVLLSQTLYFFEANLRAATVIGAIVGGGIGLLLVQAINTTKDWENVAYYVILIVLMVFLLDWLSSALRRRLIHGARESKAAPRRRVAKNAQPLKETRDGAVHP